MKGRIWLKRLIGIDYGLAIKVYILLYRSKWYIEKCPLKVIVNWVAAKDLAQTTLSHEELRTAWKVARYTRKLARFVPFESKCYDKALTVKKMLNQHDIPATLLMGVKISKEKGMEAHAWVSCGEKWIIGGEVAKEFTLVGKFA